MVKCDICGALFNERFLASHKRLSHRTRKSGSDAELNEQEILKQIMALFRKLPHKARAEVAARLISAANENPARS
jgi:hypothetical protein